MPTLSLVAASPCKVRVTITNSEGKVTWCQAVNPHSGPGQKKVEAETRGQVKGAAFAELGTQALENVGEIVTHEYGTVAAAGPFGVWIRGLKQPAVHGTSIERDTPADAFTEALRVATVPYPDVVMTWGDITRLCALDADQHDKAYADRLPAAELQELAARIRPQPDWYWVTHGLGIRGVYTARNGHTADELAAAGLLHLMEMCGRFTGELKRESRHPLYPSRDGRRCGEVVRAGGDSDLAVLRQWQQRVIDDELRDAWLEERGWQLGQTLDHSHCLIAPAAPSHGQPVFLGAHGIECKSCKAYGRTLPGRRKAGWVSWSAVVGGLDSRVYHAARGFCHWEQVAPLLSYLYPYAGTETLRLAYRAAMKLQHGADDVRIPAVFAVESKIVHVDSRWAFPNGAPVKEATLDKLLAKLPATWDDAGKPIPSRIAEFRNAETRLDTYGYARLTEVCGPRIYTQHLPWPDDTRIPLYRTATQYETCAHRYRPKSERGDPDSAWKVLERLFPGLSRDYCSWLLYTIGAAQGGTVIRTQVCGPSGAGKSATVEIAAAICGVRFGALMYQADRSRMRQGMIAQADLSDISVCDEIYKSAAAAKCSNREALDILLNSDRAVCHVPYQGQRMIARAIPMVLTEVSLPLDVVTDDQLARRLFIVRLTSKVPDWRVSCEAAGLKDIHGLRALGKEYQDACDTILSHITDECFSAATSPTVIGRALGALPMNETTEHTAALGYMREFFAAVCSSPDVVGRDASRVNGTGWKKLCMGDSDVLSDAWKDIADEQSGPLWKQSRLSDGKDWRSVLGVSGAFKSVTLEVVPYRDTTLYVRFRAVAADGAEAVNSEIR